MQLLPHPKDVPDKIWLKLANWSWRLFLFESVDDDGALLYYKLILWAFGSVS